MMVASVDQYIYLHNFINFIITNENYEDLKYVGFKMNPQDVPLPTPPTEDSQSIPSSGSERMAQSVRSISRAASRAVEDGTRSVAKSVASVAQSIFKSTKDDTETVALSSIAEDAEVAADQSNV